MIDGTQITADELRTAGHVLIGFAGILVTAIGLLLRTAYKLGHDAHKFSEGIAAIVEIKQQVAEIPILRTKFATLDEFTQRNTSDIKHLMRGSRPEWANGGGTGGSHEDG